MRNQAIHESTPTRSRSALLVSLLLAVCPPSAQAGDDTDYEDSTARYQATYVRQVKPAMHAEYSGLRSLYAGRETSYTATATGYFGWRPWQGGEIYVNPEVTQGVPFSGLYGTAGFPNGELTRTASTSPTLYLQRLFLRQTWGFGGGDQHIDADLNQMAGNVDKHRFVLTAGNFSTLDVFDDNTYAKDPRTQFMNAGFMGPLSYDYAADARGFGWGFAGEWYQNDWVLRFGRMTGPRDPNGLPIDFRILKHYGDQVEIEHAHELAGRPGKLRLLVWRNRANLASFDDALTYLKSNGLSNTQTILDVRNGDKTKYGVGINVEQQLTDELGAFMRVMQADGHTETYAFTETDGSVSFGLSMKGSAWNRERDSAGIGFLYNTISARRRNYLANGGISFFIGDGDLNYRPEQVFEIYYSWGITKSVFATADWQHMWNPAYNADRGPADFFALRLHAEF